MAARGGPPDGIRGGGSDGDDEDRSVVFDESFVRAAGLHEPTARERMHTGETPRPLRRGDPARARPGRMLIVSLIVVVVVVSVMFLALRSLLPGTSSGARAPAVLTRTALQPQGATPVAGDAADPFAGSPAQDWADGAAGLHLPEAAATPGFTAAQVQAALLAAREIVAVTQTSPPVLRGARPVVAEALLDPVHGRQLAMALDNPADDDIHAATGWVTRFDPTVVEQLDPSVRVQAQARVTERAEDDLSVVVDGVFVYAVRLVGADPGAWTRFVVHRTWDFHADHAGLRHGVLAVRSIVTLAGPQDCGAESAAWFRPSFPGSEGERGAAPGPADPYAVDPATPGAVRCGTFTGNP